MAPVPPLIVGLVNKVSSALDCVMGWRNRESVDWNGLPLRLLWQQFERNKRINDVSVVNLPSSDRLTIPTGEIQLEVKLRVDLISRVNPTIQDPEE